MKKCAIYTRVSTTMQADKEYNSCDAQRDRMHAYIKSQEDLQFYKEYTDPAFSGKDLDRPALKSLLEDIKAGKVQAVLTYKIDRLTRSSKDFYNLIELFDRHGVSYISVTEHFDTSSSAGRLLRNIMLTFAQFERELLSERVRHACEQRARKGYWNGGYVPYGYRKVNKRLAVDKGQSGYVRHLFNLYAETGSIKVLCDYVKNNDIKADRIGRIATGRGIHFLLSNRAYVGETKYKKEFFPGNHEPLVSNELFDEVGRMLALKSRPDMGKSANRRRYGLAGIITCAECSSYMTSSFTVKKKRRYFYYRCTKVVKRGREACSVKEVNAEKIEAFITDYLTRVATDQQFIENLVFRMVHNSPRKDGVELSGPTPEMLVTRIQQVLMNFKNKANKGTRIERSLLFRGTLKGVGFGREFMELVVPLSDEDCGVMGRAGRNPSGGVAARSREGQPDLPTPACTESSILQKMWR
jgi:site-specific DNA recombinase